MHRRTLLQALGAAALAAPAIAQGRATQVLRFVPQSNLPTLDPMFSSQVVGNHALCVCDTLYALNGQGVPVPQMAEGHAVSDDGLRWTIRLRDGLRFHDGAPVRAADAVASLRRWARLDTFGKLLAAAVDEWSAPDDRTVAIRLRRPFPLLLDALGGAVSPMAAVLPERLARTDPATPISEVVGSGPYRFKADEYVSGSRVVYERFDGYVPRPEPPDRAAGGKVAHFPRLEWHIIPDASTANAALLAGEVDWVELPSPDFYTSLKADRRVALQVDDPAGKVSFMRLNHLQPPFDNPGVRRAVLAAVRQADYMGSILGDDPELWRQCLSQFPCGTPYEVAEDALMPGDLAAGRALLAQAGYGGARAVVLGPTDNPLSAPFGAVTADLLGRLGIAADLVSMDWATAVQRRASKQPVEKGGWSVLHSYASSNSYANPAINYLLRGDGAAGWFGWWSNPAAPALVQDWLDTPDLGRRVQLGRQLGRLATEDVAIVPLGQWFGRTAFSRRITGVLPGGNPYFWNVTPA